jgi:type I restriction enzyme M protein
MSNVTHDIVAKLWNLCNVLKDDGVTYHQYVTELTYLLFLKMAKETGTEKDIPADHRWDTLVSKAAPDRLEAYKLALVQLGSAKTRSKLVKEIYANATSFIRKPTTLSTLVTEIDKLDWYSARQEGLGDLYEGLLQKNANEKKSGAGQYFTPRPLVDSMIAVMQPTLDDIIQDPAAGTGGYPLINTLKPARGRSSHQSNAALVLRATMDRPNLRSKDLQQDPFGNSEESMWN